MPHQRDPNLLVALNIAHASATRDTAKVFNCGGYYTWSEPSPVPTSPTSVSTVTKTSCGWWLKRAFFSGGRPAGVARRASLHQVLMAVISCSAQRLRIVWSPEPVLALK
jgi:hypothetical protein